MPTRRLVTILTLLQPCFHDTFSADEDRKSTRLGINVTNLIIYLFPYLVSAAVAAGLGIYVLRRLPHSSLLNWVAIYMFSQTVWTLLYIGELVAADISAKLIWDSLQWIPTFTVTYAWMRLALDYTNVNFTPRWLLYAAFIPPLIFICLVFTDPLHKLIFTEVYLESAPPFDALIYTFTPLIWTFTVYLYLLYIGSAIFMVINASNDTTYRRPRTLIIVAGSALPIIITLVTLLTDTRIFGQRDAAPFASLVGGVIIIWGLLRYKLFDIVPLARALVFDNLSQGLVVVDVENRIMDANAAALAIVGRTMREIFGQPFKRVYEEWSQVIDNFDQVNEFITDVQSTSPDGRIHHHELRIMAIRKPNGAVIGRLITYHDITDRKRAEIALHGAQQRARLLADVAFEGITIHRNGFLVDSNRAFLDLVGYTFEELKGVSLTDTVLAPEWRESARASIAEKRPTHSLTEVINKDGKRIPVEMRSRQIDDETRVTVVRDLSERREAEVQRVNAALERERSAMLAEFVRSVAHEFRTPLANISTSLYLIGKIPDGAQRAERIKQTENAIHELAALLDHMLLMVKLDHVPNLERRPLRLNSLMETVTMKYQSEITAKNLAFQFEPVVDLPMIMGDEGLLTQAFSELMVNAIRFTPEKGQIKVLIARDDRAAQVSISDSGIGMSETEKTRVFERFYRADEARTTRGFGLGLAIADRIIMLHRGSISVTSSAGAGSTFTISLPIG